MDLNQFAHENALIESSYFIPRPDFQVESKDEPVIDNKTNKSTSEGIKKDLKNIILLIFLYLLQGVPLGLAASIPFILASRKISYADQGTYSFSLWPFSLKLLWAPIVDCLYFKRLGRRKSWLIPVQLLIGIFMISLADFTQKLVYNLQSKTDIVILTLIFTMFCTLVATQDIAVDGWAISMLSKENVTWQSTCNGIGQTTGFFIGNISFIVFESANFCNKYIRPVFNLPQQPYGMVTLKMFMYVFGSVFLVTSILVLLLKKEKSSEDEPKKSLFESYKVIWDLLCLRSIRILALILLTVKIGLAAESVTFLKIIEHGVSKEKLSLLAIPMAPFNILLPAFITKYTKSKPLILFMRALPVRLCFGLVVALFIYLTPKFKDQNNEYPLSYFLICLVLTICASMVETTMFISQMGFYASVSDESIGATYMTFLATLGNLGGTYPGTIALYLTNFFTVKYCSQEEIFGLYNSTSSLYNSTFYSDNLDLIKANKCSSSAIVKQCIELGGKCLTKIDAYYFLSIGFTIIGFIWIIIFRKKIIMLSSLPKLKWRIKKN